jgi:hypothetical protein
MHLLAFLLSTALVAIVPGTPSNGGASIAPSAAAFVLRAAFRLHLKKWRRIAALPDRALPRTVSAVFGPISLLGLAAVWALGLLTASAGLQWSAGSNPAGARDRPFPRRLYLSGTTFLRSAWETAADRSPARLITVAEAGTGSRFWRS